MGEWTGERAQGSGTDASSAPLFPIAGLALLAVSAWIPWAISRLGESNASPRLVDLTMARWVFLGCSIGIAASLLAERRGQRHPGWRSLAVVCAVVVTVVPILGMAVIELLTVWFSPERLPTTLRRLTLGVKPMPGIWLAGIGGALCLVGATGQEVTAERWLRGLGRGLRNRSRLAWMTVTLLAAVTLLGAARYATWVRIDSSVDTWAIPGWAMPWIGLLSLAAMLSAAALGLFAATRPSVGSGVALATVGWAISFLAGMTIVTAVSIPTVTAPGWVVERLESMSERATSYAAASPVDVTVPDIPTELQVGLSIGPGAPLTFASGLLVIGCAWVACRHAATEAER